MLPEICGKSRKQMAHLAVSKDQLWTAVLYQDKKNKTKKKRCMVVIGAFLYDFSPVPCIFMEF